MSALQEEARVAGKAELFQELREYLVESPDDASYAHLAARFGMRSNTLAVAVHRLRQRLRACVRVELAETVSSEPELEEELDTLRQVLGGRRRAGAEPARQSERPKL